MMGYVPYNYGFHSDHRMVFIGLDLKMIDMEDNWIPNQRTLNSRNTKHVTDCLKELCRLFKSKNVLYRRNTILQLKELTDKQ